MKAAILPSSVAIAVALLLAGCNKQPATPPAAPAPDAASAAAVKAEDQAPPDQRVDTVTVTADAVTVGSALGPNQAATAPKPVYATTDTVYASASARGHSGATARVYWTYQDGTSHKEEEKAVAGDVINFSFSQADGMKAGAYNVEIDLNDVPVGIADFKVQ